MGPNFSAYIRNVGRDPFIDGEQAGPGPNAGSPNWPQQQQPSAPAVQRPAGVRPPNPNYIPPMDVGAGQYNSAHRGRTIPVPPVSQPRDRFVDAYENNMSGSMEEFGARVGVVKPLPAPRITNTPGDGFQRVGPRNNNPIAEMVLGAQQRQLQPGIHNTPLVRGMRENPSQFGVDVRDAMLRDSARDVETTTVRPATPSTATPQRTPGVQRSQPQAAPARRRPSVNAEPTPYTSPNHGRRVSVSVPSPSPLDRIPGQYDPNSVTPYANAIEPVTAQLGFPEENFGHMSRANAIDDAAQTQELETQEQRAPRRGRRTGAPSTRRRGRN